MPPDADGPALTLVEQVGTGAHTAVWRARADDGQQVALKRLRPDAPPDAVDDLRREADLLGRVDSPYLVRLRALVADGPQPALLLDEARGGSLDRLLAARGRLLPGEVVTVAVPLALALAALHGSGVLHGDLRPSCVLLTGDGMALLSGLGRRPVLGATPGDDVRALAGLCVLMLTGRAAVGVALGPDVPPELRAVLGPALGAAPGTASALARALRGGGAALPVRMPEGEGPPGAPSAPAGTVSPSVGPASAPTLTPLPASAPCTSGSAPDAGAARRVVVGRGAHARRGRSRLALVALAGAAGLAVAAGLGWQLGRTGPPASAAALAPRPDASASEVPSPSRSVTPSPSPSATSPSATSPSATSPSATSPSATSPSAPAPTGASSPAASPSPTTARSPYGPAPTGAAPASTTVPTPAARRSAPASPDWAAVLGRLDAARSTALARVDPTALGAVDAPRSPALAADLVAVRQLQAAGQAPRGLRHRLAAVQVASASGDTVRLRVRDLLLPYDLVGPDGSVHEPGRPERTFEVVLTRSSAGYRLAEVGPT